MLTTIDTPVAQLNQSRKRRREDDAEPEARLRPLPSTWPDNIQVSPDNRLLHQNDPGSHKIWPNQSLFAKNPFLWNNYHDAANFQVSEFFLSPDTGRAAWDSDIASLPPLLIEDTQSQEVTDLIFPALPSAAHRQISPNTDNPFAVDAQCRHGSLRTDFSDSKAVEANGYIKICLQPPTSGIDGGPIATNRFYHPEIEKRNRQTTLQHGQIPSSILPYLPQLPPNFGRGMKLDDIDQKLLTFCMYHSCFFEAISETKRGIADVTAFCQGRTLLPRENYWLTEFTPMAELEPVVQHALLAFAGSYVLDYYQDEVLRLRVNAHYRTASHLISQLLLLPFSPTARSSSEHLVAAILLLEGDDVRLSIHENSPVF